MDSLVCKSYKWHFTDDETISNHLLISDQVQPKFSEIQKRIYANQVSKQMKLKPIEWFRFVNSNFPLMLVDHLAWNLCSYKSARLCIDHLVCSAKIISFGKIDDAAAFAGFLGQFYECTIIEFDQFFKQIATLIVEIDDRTIYWRVCLAIIGLEKLKSFEIPQLNYSLEFMTDFISELLIKSEVRVLPFKLTERMIILLGNVKILMQKFGQDSLEFQNARILDRFYCDGLGWWGDWPECIGRWRNCLPRDGTLYAKNQIIHHKYSNDSSIFNYNELLIMISQRGRRGAIYAHEFEELQINIASDFDLPTVSVAKEKFTGSPVNKQLFRTNSGIKCFGRRPRLNLECGEIQSRSSENLVAVRNVIEISKLLASLLETFLFKCFNNDSRINTRDSIFEIGLWDPIAKLIVMCLVYGDSVIERNPFRISKSSWSILYSFGSSRSHCKNRHLIVLWRFLNDYQLFDAVPLPILLRSLGFSDEV